MPITRASSVLLAAWVTTLPVASIGCGDDDSPAADAAPIADAAPGAVDAPPGLDGAVADAAATDAAVPDASPPAPDAATAACVPTPGTNLALELVTDGLRRPVLVTAPAGDPRLFVVEQIGRIMIVEDGALLPTPFLDVQDILIAGGEQGLLGLAFHPQYAINGRFFIHYSEDGTGDTRIAEYHVSAGDPNIADTTGIPVLSVDQPYGNHNGGMIEFGPDGYLYIALGDGGDGGDPDGNGQNPETLLGAILRIDVDGGAPYAIPATNPFVGGPGADEIWAWGLRNPWRMSFDRDTGDLYIGDVGQGAREEVDVQPADSAGGVNYGWNIMEGTRCYPTGPCDSTGLTPPVHEYSHDDGCSITGGYVYRGACMPDVQGTYFFGDYCSERIWSLKMAGGVATEVTERTGDLESTTMIGGQGLSSFGQDGYGELYVVGRGSTNGRIFRIVAE